MIWFSSQTFESLAIFDKFSNTLSDKVAFFDSLYINDLIILVELEIKDMRVALLTVGYCGFYII